MNTFNTTFKALILSLLIISFSTPKLVNATHSPQLKGEQIEQQISTHGLKPALMLERARNAEVNPMTGLDLNFIQEAIKTAAISKAETKIANPKGVADGGKSQIVALALVFFIGVLGIHRFYLGYIWQGIVQLLTLGGCGIWSLIDLVRIATGDLGPKNGSYSETI